MLNLYNTIVILLTLHNLYCTCKSQNIINDTKAECYIGFLPLDFRGKPISSGNGVYCAKIKGPDTYFNKNNECFQNIARSEIYKDYIPWTRDDVFYWSDYMRAYENGPFINQNKHDSNFGRVKDFPEEYPINGAAMCAVVNITSSRLHAVSCHEKYHSLCVVLRKSMFAYDYSCPAKYHSFDGPLVTCLKYIRTESEVTATEAMTLCQKNSGYLLQQGYIYSRMIAGEITEIPLGIKNGKNGPQWSIQDLVDGHYSEIPKSNWDGINEFSSVSFQNEKFTVKEQSHKYTEIVCEHSPKIPVIEIILTFKYLLEGIINGYKKSLVLELKGEWKKSRDFKIECFTDSVTYYPTKVLFTWGEEVFINAENDGYYWCIIIKSSNFNSLISNKILFLSNGEATKHVQAYLLQFPKEMQIREINASIKRNFPEAKIKRIYKNTTLLIHSTPPVKTNYEVKILYQRNLQQCEETNEKPKTDIGKSVVVKKVFSTIYYKCQGDYNVGAFWEEEKIENHTTDIYSSTPMYSKEVEQVLENLQDMHDSPVSVNDLETALSDVNNVLLLKDTDVPNALAQNIDDMLDEVEIPSDQAYIKIIHSNIAVIVAKRGGPDPVVGIRVQAIGNGSINDSTIHPLTEGDFLDPNSYDSNDDIVAKVPSSICHGANGKLSFTLFKDDAAFPKENNSDWEVNSRVLSISLDNKTCFKKSDYVDIYFRPYDNRQSNKKKACAYWDFDQGNWSTNICILLPAEKNRPLDICRCYHLTHFAQIVTYVDLASEKELKIILFTIIYVTGTVSLIGLVIIFLTGVISKTWRAKFSNQMWLHLAISLFLLTVSFMIISMLDFSSHTPLLCIGTGVVLHYAVLSFFTWLTVSAFMTYKKMIRVIKNNSPYKFFKLCAAGWILPILPIIVLVCADSNSYLLHFKRGHSEMDFCYPTELGYWLTVVFPVAFFVIVNTILFGLIISTIYIGKNVASPDFNRNIIKKCCFTFIIFMIYGLTWTYGIFSDNIYVAYLFCFVVATQGFVLFIFFMILSKKSRIIWVTYLGIQYESIKTNDTEDQENTDTFEIKKIANCATSDQND